MRIIEYNGMKLTSSRKKKIWWQGIHQNIRTSHQPTKLRRQLQWLPPLRYKVGNIVTIPCPFSHEELLKTTWKKAWNVVRCMCGRLAVIVSFSVTSGRVTWYRAELTSVAKRLASCNSPAYFAWLNWQDNTELLWLLGTVSRYCQATSESSEEGCLQPLLPLNTVFSRRNKTSWEMVKIT
jgi:hypothetical protein